MKSIHENRIADLLQDLRPESLCSTHSLAERMRQLFTPGVSIALIDDFELGWAGGFGTQRRGEENAVSADTLFQAASISKSVFALAVMRLAKSRKIDLDADVNDYLVSWRVPEHRGWQPQVTLRQLLSHTAGMTEHGFAGYPTSEPWPTLTEVLRRDSACQQLANCRGYASRNASPVLRRGYDRRSTSGDRRLGAINA